MVMHPGLASRTPWGMAAAGQGTGLGQQEHGRVMAPVLLGSGRASCAAVAAAAAEGQPKGAGAGTGMPWAGCSVWGFFPAGLLLLDWTDFVFIMPNLIAILISLARRDGHGLCSASFSIMFSSLFLWAQM